MTCSDLTYLHTSLLDAHTDNPRTITKEQLKRLEESILKNGFWLHRPLAVIQKGERYVVLAGNQRLKVVKKLKMMQVPCVVYSDLTKEEELDIMARDNVNNGEWDFNLIEVSEAWASFDFGSLGLSLPDISFNSAGLELSPADGKEKEKKKPSFGQKKEDKDEIEDDYEEDEQKEAFYLSMFKDCLYESNNPFDIPNLLLERQAGKLELPFTPWGANSRLRKDVATYHFYVDDYRFESLFKDPIKLLLSGCKAIVEPNCSCHDQTPIAWGLQLIYKKRWLARYLQECGIDVYADLNVSHKFAEYNKMGIPDGYNAFFTRGTEGWIKSLEIDLRIAQEISGLERPNLIVYAGGKEVQEFCQKHSLLYVTDFINAKKQ